MALATVSPLASTALIQSVNRWVEILYFAQHGKYDQITMGSEECPLCNLFLSSEPNNLRTPVTSRACKECPVKIKTGKRYCHDTPYMNAAAAFDIVRHVQRRTGRVPEVHQKNLIEAIKTEIAFLKSCR